MPALPRAEAAAPACAPTAATTMAGRSRRSRRSNSDLLNPDVIWMPLTRWAATTPRDTSSTARWRRRAMLDLGVVLVGAVGANRRRAPAASGRRSASRPDSRRAGGGDDGRVAVGGAAAQAGRLDSGRRRQRGARRRRRALQRRTHRRDRDGRARRVRDAHRRGSAGAGRHHPDPQRVRRAARRRRQRRVPAASTSCNSRSWEASTPAWCSASTRRASACSRSARRRRKGNELTRESHRLLKASLAAVHRQRRGARRLPRTGGRDCLRRLHRQRGAEDQRGARRPDRGTVAHGVERDHGLLGARRRAVARRQRHRHRRPRPIERQGRAQWRDRWRTGSRRTA